MKSLLEQGFKKEFVSNFKGDDTGNLSPRQTPEVFYSKAVPTPVKSPKLLAWSDDLAKELGISKPTTDKEIDVLAGNRITSSMYPYAGCYAGHQFGNWAGQLGDGRAITLGEWQAPDGKLWELQLKGAGPTAYSRRADGRAVLRSSVREYLMSEAMHYLGVPTTRALSLVSTGEQVLRDIFYDGHPAYEPGAIVMRVAPTFLRFGNFEILAARQQKEYLKQLVDWTITRYFPHITGEDKVLIWYKEIVERTAFLMSEWLRVGFVHGVMNTDNMSILGLTIDYGPYSFVDDYDPAFTPNTTDLPGRRYAFGRQASVAKWNLSILGGALAPLFDDTNELAEILDSYDDVFWSEYFNMMTRKIGLDETTSDDTKLIKDLEHLLATIKPDMTIFFQLLIDIKLNDEEDAVKHFEASFYDELKSSDIRILKNFIAAYSKRIEKNTISNEERIKIMKATNPRIILRNYLLHQAIEELENGNNSLFQQLQDVMKNPYSKKYDHFFAKRPEWAQKQAGCSKLSCSS